MSNRIQQHISMQNLMPKVKTFFHSLHWANFDLSSQFFCFHSTHCVPSLTHARSTTLFYYTLPYPWYLSPANPIECIHTPELNLNILNNLPVLLKLKLICVLF